MTCRFRSRAPDARARDDRGRAARVHARRTLNDSFIILDEAQNTTSEQMKMFLTRLGYNSKAVITGDVTANRFCPAQAVGIEGSEHRARQHFPASRSCGSTTATFVRHRLVQSIIKAYESFLEGPADAPNTN